MGSCSHDLAWVALRVEIGAFSDEDALSVLLFAKALAIQ